MTTMTDTGNPSEKKQWQETGGFAADTMMVHITVPEAVADRWTEEADEAGFDSRAAYLRTLINEARAYRAADLASPHRADERITELEAELAETRETLREARDGSTTFQLGEQRIESFLTDEYQSLGEILQRIVESGVLEQAVRREVENALYYLAAQDHVQYERGWGWKLAGDDR